MNSQGPGEHTRAQASADSAMAVDGANPVRIEWRRVDLTSLTLELQQLLDLGPGENQEARHKVTAIISRLRKILPSSHFRDERLRDLVTDFELWFSNGPRLQFDYNDEALRSMLLVDIHRIKTSL